MCVWNLIFQKAPVVLTNLDTQIHSYWKLLARQPSRSLNRQIFNCGRQCKLKTVQFIFFFGNLIVWKFQILLIVITWFDFETHFSPYLVGLILLIEGMKKRAFISQSSSFSQQLWYQSSCWTPDGPKLTQTAIMLLMKTSLDFQQFCA